MKTRVIRKLALAVAFGGTAGLLAACDPNATYTGSAYTYHDAMIWNDYYYGHPRPPAGRPPKPEHPIARPPVARPPIHRPPVARPMPR